MFRDIRWIANDHIKKRKRIRLSHIQKIDLPEIYRCGKHGRISFGHFECMRAYITAPYISLSQFSLECNGNTSATRANVEDRQVTYRETTVGNDPLYQFLSFWS